MGDLAVVFGGSGFLGSHVADALQEAGLRVRICDIADSPFLAPGQEMVRCDILDPAAVARAVAGAAVVYNFAGLADIDESRDKPVDTVKLNVLGNTHILDACRREAVRRYVFASTVYVYSERGSFYRASKQASERIIEAYQERLASLHHPALRLPVRPARRRPQRDLRILHAALTGARWSTPAAGTSSASTSTCATRRFSRCGPWSRSSPTST